MNLESILEFFYEQMDGNEMVEEYHDRHGTESAGILTVYDDERASLIVEHLRERIAGKVVIEVGGGIGLLACHLAEVADRVICFEVDPAWCSSFVMALYAKKPANLTFVFGRAQELVGMVRGDVAIFCTHSGHDSLTEIAGQFAPEVIDVYGELGFRTNVTRVIPEPLDVAAALKQGREQCAKSARNLYEALKRNGSLPNGRTE